MHVLVDSASWLTRTVVALVRLREPIATELEEKRDPAHAVRRARARAAP